MMLTKKIWAIGLSVLVSAPAALAANPFSLITTVLYKDLATDSQEEYRVHVGNHLELDQVQDQVWGEVASVLQRALDAAAPTTYNVNALKLACKPWVDGFCQRIDLPQNQRLVVS